MGLYHVLTNARRTRGRALPDKHTYFLWNEIGRLDQIQTQEIDIDIEVADINSSFISDRSILHQWYIFYYSGPCLSAISCHVRNGFSCVSEVLQRFAKVLQVLGEEAASTQRGEPLLLCMTFASESLREEAPNLAQHFS